MTRSRLSVANPKKAVEDAKVTGISQIARAKGWNKWVKVTIFVICTAGMLYQAFRFTEIFLQYPVTLNVEVQYPDGIMMPALTICTGYTFNKEKYCGINKDHCEDINDTWVVKEPYRYVDKNSSREDLLKYGYTWENLEFIVETTWNKDRFFSKDDPYPIQVLDDIGKTTECFVTNHQSFEINKTLALYPTKRKSLFFPFLTANTYILDFNEYRFGKRLYHRTISAHSPFTFSNPYKEGVRVPTNTIMLGIVQMSETYLLPAPYRTNCMDYFRLWEQNKTNPLSRSICVNKCMYTMISEACQCFPLGVIYPSKMRFCGKDDERCVETIDIEECYFDCKPDCHSFSYDLRITPRSFEYRLSSAMRLVTLTDHADDSENLTEISEVNGISLLFASNEKIVYRYKPKYEIIEFFSFMGGFSGIWMGISVWALVDLFGVTCHARTAKRRLSTTMVVIIKQV